jgi:membrane-bound lytic murein transglycosylase B
MLKSLIVLMSLIAAPVFVTPLAAQTCGGTFSAFLGGLADEAATKGIDRTTTEVFLAGARQDQSVLIADQSQGFFQRDFIDFSQRLISSNRIENGHIQA